MGKDTGAEDAPTGEDGTDGAVPPADADGQEGDAALPAPALDGTGLQESDLDEDNADSPDPSDADASDGEAAPAHEATRRHRGAGSGANARSLARRNTRQCIVTRERDPPEGLIRFVADPEGRVVPDLAAKLPGRGAHVTARHDLVMRAARRHMFRRALKAEVVASDDLADEVARLMREGLVRMLPILRKAGNLVSGSGKVDSAVRSGEALIVLHAAEASEDGVRKIAQARHALATEGGPNIDSTREFNADELARAFADASPMHAAVLASGGGRSFKRRLEAYASYCQSAQKGRHEREPGEQTGSEPT